MLLKAHANGERSGSHLNMCFPKPQRINRCPAPLVMARRVHHSTKAAVRKIQPHLDDRSGMEAMKQIVEEGATTTVLTQDTGDPTGAVLLPRP